MPALPVTHRQLKPAGWYAPPVPPLPFPSDPLSAIITE